jgi:hypothetical protein
MARNAPACSLLGQRAGPRRHERLDLFRQVYTCKVCRRIRNLEAAVDDSRGSAIGEAAQGLDQERYLAIIPGADLLKERVFSLWRPSGLPRSRRTSPRGSRAIAPQW